VQTGQTDIQHIWERQAFSADWKVFLAKIGNQHGQDRQIFSTYKKGRPSAQKGQTLSKDRHSKRIGQTDVQKI
jgi:hypothetical protein